MKFRVGVCDSDNNVCSLFEKEIREYFIRNGHVVEIFVWNSAEVFMKDVPLKISIDILFSDIELPGLSGIDLGKYIREECKDAGMHIIYISERTECALDLFKLHPYNFLIKPVCKEKICDEIENLFYLDKQNKRFFIYEYNRIRHTVPISDIIYFMSERKHIKIVCADRTEEYVGKLRDELKKLPSEFVMIGQSYIVNLRHINQSNINSVIVGNGECLNVSRNYRKLFNTKMIEYSKF